MTGIYDHTMNMWSRSVTLKYYKQKWFLYPLVKIYIVYMLSRYIHVHNEAHGCPGNWKQREKLEPITLVSCWSIYHVQHVKSVFSKRFIMLIHWHLSRSTYLWVDSNTAVLQPKNSQTFFWPVNFFIFI